MTFAGLLDARKPIGIHRWGRAFTVVTGEPGEVSGGIPYRQPVISHRTSWTFAPDTIPACEARHGPKETCAHFR
jgi:hypothetical protein